MPKFKASLPGLRVFARDGSKSFKFRAGQIEVDADEADEIRAFAQNRGHYGIVEINDDGTPVDQEAAEDAGPPAQQDPPVASDPATQAALATPVASAPEVVGTTPPEGSTDATGDGGDDLEAMTVPELQELASQRGLKKGGNKADLIARLSGKEA